MKVIIKTPTEAEFAERDWRSFYQIHVDDKRVFSVQDDEPEDSNLSRSFNDVYKIQELLEMAYEAGKKGEALEIKHIEVGPGED